MLQEVMKVWGAFLIPPSPLPFHRNKRNISWLQRSAWLLEVTEEVTDGVLLQLGQGFCRIGDFLSTITTFQSGPCQHRVFQLLRLLGRRASSNLPHRWSRSVVHVLFVLQPGTFLARRTLSIFHLSRFPLPVETGLLDPVPLLDLLIGVLSRDGCAGKGTAGGLELGVTSSASLPLASLGLFFGVLIPSAVRFLFTYCSTEKISEATLATNLASSSVPIPSSFLAFCFC